MAFVIFGILIAFIKKTICILSMKKQLLIFFLFTSTLTFSQSVKLEAISPQKELAFKGGEWLKFRMSYSNFFNAGFSTIEVKETKNLNKDAFHIIGKGKSTGLVSLFFKVKDDYKTFIATAPDTDGGIRIKTLLLKKSTQKMT